MSIYLYRNNQQDGPYEEATIREWLQNGQLSPNDLAITDTEDTTEWEPLEVILKSIDWKRRLEPHTERLEKGMTINKAFRSMKHLAPSNNKTYEYLKDFGLKKHSAWAKEDLRSIDVARDLHEKAEREEILFLIVDNEDEYVFYTATESDANAAQKKSGCFIATAAYGSPLASEVIFLSRFRDEFLLKSKLGDLFVNFYYLISPPIASFISKVAFFRAATRVLLIAPILHLLKATKFKS